MGKMKKDKKWFVDKWTKERGKTDVHDPMYHFINEFIADVNQLDEPEVLSQEWIDEHTYHEDEYDFYYVDPDELKNLIVPKQELPVIPKYMHEWITNHRDKYDLYPALKRLEGNPLGWERFYTWYRVNTHKFVNAYLTGEYEVEDEQKYNVQLKVRSSFGTVGVFLYKQGDEVLAGDNFKVYYPEGDKFRLTEQEIKDFDPRCWTFAEPVE